MMLLKSLGRSKRCEVKVQRKDEKRRRGVKKMTKDHHKLRFMTDDSRQHHSYVSTW